MYKITCVVCNKEFNSSSKERKCCCQYCKSQYEENPNKYTNKIKYKVIKTKVQQKVSIKPELSEKSNIILKEKSDKKAKNTKTDMYKEERFKIPEPKNTKWYRVLKGREYFPPETLSKILFEMNIIYSYGQLTQLRYTQPGKYNELERKAKCFIADSVM